MSDYFDGFDRSEIGSRLALAFRDLADSAAEPDEGLYGQIRRVTVGSLMLSTDAGFDIEFSIPFDDDPEINESTVEIFNLNRTDVQQITPGAPIIVEAGYANDSYGQILNGKVVSVRNYWDGLDHITEITCNDYNGTADTEVKDMSFPPGMAASQILRELVNLLGIPVAVFQVPEDHTYEQAVKIDGSVMDAVRKYAKACSVSAWINRSSLYVCPLSQAISDGYVDLSAATGLLSVEEWQETEKSEDPDGEDKIINGITTKMLLQHRVYTGCTVVLNSRNVSGQFKVREGSHSAEGTEMTTTVKAVRMG